MTSNVDLAVFGEGDSDPVTGMAEEDAVEMARKMRLMAWEERMISRWVLVRC